MIQQRKDTNFSVSNANQSQNNIAQQIQSYVTQINSKQAQLKNEKIDNYQQKNLEKQQQSNLSTQKNSINESSKQKINVLSQKYLIDELIDCKNENIKEFIEQNIESVSMAKELKEQHKNDYLGKRVHLRQKYYYSNKMTLILDLDETLLHCNQSLHQPSDTTITITISPTEIIQAGINIRPFAKEFIKELSFYYEIIIFTASHSCYANNAIDLLDPNHQYIQHRLYRENCILTQEGVYIKDLRIFENRNIDKLILVDNACYSFGFQINNGIPIIPFYDDQFDNQLFILCKFLKQIHNKPNLPEFLQDYFKIEKYDLFTDIHSLIDGLYRNNEKDQHKLKSQIQQYNRKK